MLPRNAFRFFMENAGYVVGERAKGALALARAERDATNAGLVFVWENDDDADYSYLDQKDARGKFLFTQGEDHSAEWCRIVRPCAECTARGFDTAHGWTGNEPATCRHADVLASLSGIIDADANYRRVVQAELAMEALHTSRN